jgi:hypothetical protein
MTLGCVVAAAGVKTRIACARRPSAAAAARTTVTSGRVFGCVVKPPFLETLIIGCWSLNHYSARPAKAPIFDLDAVDYQVQYFTEAVD